MIQKNNFLVKFRKLFDETDESFIQFDTKFKDLEEWSSLIILSLMVMCEEEFNTRISPGEIEKSIYVSDLIHYAENNLITNE
jgi:acyl carrier protein